MITNWNSYSLSKVIESQSYMRVISEMIELEEKVSFIYELHGTYFCSLVYDDDTKSSFDDV